MSQSQKVRKRLRRIKKDPYCEICSCQLELSNSCLYRLGEKNQKNRPIKLLCYPCLRNMPEYQVVGEGRFYHKIRKKRYKENPFCFYCNARLDFVESTLDHRTPRSEGGKDNEQNLVLSCNVCNNAKENYSEHHFRTFILPNLLIKDKQ